MNENVAKPSENTAKTNADAFRAKITRLIEDAQTQGLIIRTVHTTWTENDQLASVRLTYTEPNSNNANLTPEGAGSEQKNN